MISTPSRSIVSSSTFFPADMVRFFRVGLICVIVAGDLLTRTSGCFNRDKDLPLCMRKNNISIPIFRGPIGFDFGWGSVDQTEEMCQTRGHIRTLMCMKKLVNNNCRGTKQFDLKRLLLEAVFDINPYTRAANYMCHEENMQIFNENRECLKKQESNAQKCSARKTHSMADAMKDLHAQTKGGSAPSRPVEYKNFVYRIMHQYQCQGQTASMQCIFHKIHAHCNKRIVLLLMNYYKELLPNDCKLHFNYESALKTMYEPSNDQVRPFANLSRVISPTPRDSGDFGRSPSIGLMTFAATAAVVILVRTVGMAAST